MPNTTYKFTDGSFICFQQIITPDGKKLDEYELIYKSDAPDWTDPDQSYKPDQFKAEAERFGLSTDRHLVDN